MKASEEQIDALLKLQAEDIKLTKLRKAFEELPQRQNIVDLRNKREVVQQKSAQVEKMLAAADKKVDNIVREDEKLEQRQAEIQRDIDAAGSDYRNMEARSKEMAGAGRRRDELVGMLEMAEAERDKVVSVKDQLAAASAKLEQLEQAEIASFRKEGGALKESIAAQEATRAKIAAEIQDDLLQQYDRIAAASGVAIGVMNGNRCGVCRTPFDEVRQLEVKHQAPLAICPHCKRLLVVGA